MKVLIISGSFPPIKCGVGDYTDLLSQHLIKYCDVTVLTSTEAQPKIDTPVKVINTINNWQSYSVVKTIMREIKKGHYDIVHFQFPTIKYYKKNIAFYIRMPWLLRLRGIKVVYTLHEYNFANFLSVVIRKPALYRSNQLIIVDPAFLLPLKKRNPLLSLKKINFIPIGTSILKSIAPQSEITQLREKILENTNHQKILVYFGFIAPNKCFDIILKALGKLKITGQLTTKLLIVGEFNATKCSTDYFSNLQTIITKYNLQDDIYITGYADGTRVGDYFRTADAAILLYQDGVSIRNSSMLAIKQEGLKIITTTPKQSYDFFNDPSFIMTQNDVEQVSQKILSLQNGEYDKIDVKSMIFSWDEIA